MSLLPFRSGFRGVTLSAALWVCALSFAGCTPTRGYKPETSPPPETRSVPTTTPPPPRPGTK